MDVRYFREVLEGTRSINKFIELHEDYFMDVVLKEFGNRVNVSYVPYDGIEGVNGGLVGIKVSVIMQLGEYGDADNIYNEVYLTLKKYFNDAGIIVRHGKSEKKRSRDNNIVFSQIFLLRYLLSEYGYEFEQENIDGSITLITRSPFEGLK